jgi:uncharacterized HAD superfamily protein
MTIQFRSYAQLADDVTLLLAKLPRTYAAVCGIPRSGMVPASMIAMEMGVPIMMLGSDDLGSGRRVRLRGAGRTLVVDDSVYRGGAMAAARQVFGTTADYACVYVTPGSEHLVNHYAVQLPGPRHFQWNVLGCKATENFMFDMDGVLCLDPQPFDDDGPDYIHAIANAAPLHLPTVPIAAICTNRIERHRAVTEAWLKTHGVKYGRLIMQEYDTAAERRRCMPAPNHKAHHYKASGCGLFVESHAAQAMAIHKLAGKPVLVVDGWQIFQG